MDPALVDGAAGGDEGLCGNLAAKDAKAGFVEVLSTKDVDLDRLEIEQFDELAQGLGHG